MASGFNIEVREQSNCLEAKCMNKLLHILIVLATQLN